MVFFTCNACGSSVKKNQVEKHWQNECPNCEILSCIDCGKDFHGDEYASHTKCVSEAEKYQGALYKDSGGNSKGERKQQEWLERVRTSVSGASVSPKIARLLERIAEYPNIPRKKAKFENFVRNSCNVRDQGTLEELWTAFSAANEKRPDGAQEQPVATRPPDVRPDSQVTQTATCDRHGDVEEESEDGQERKKDKRKKEKDAVAREGTDATRLEEKGSGVDAARKRKHMEAKHLENGRESPIQATSASTSSARKKHKHKKEKERDAESQKDPMPMSMEGASPRKHKKEKECDAESQKGPVPLSMEAASPRKHKKRQHREQPAGGEEEAKKAKVDDDASVEELAGPRDGTKTKKHKHKHQ